MHSHPGVTAARAPAADQPSNTNAAATTAAERDNHRAPMKIPTFRSTRPSGTSGHSQHLKPQEPAAQKGERHAPGHRGAYAHHRPLTTTGRSDNARCYSGLARRRGRNTAELLVAPEDAAETGLKSAPSRAEPGPRFASPAVLQAGRPPTETSKA